MSTMYDAHEKNRASFWPCEGAVKVLLHLKTSMTQEVPRIAVRSGARGQGGSGGGGGGSCSLPKLQQSFSKVQRFWGRVDTSFKHQTAVVDLGPH